MLSHYYLSGLLITYFLILRLRPSELLQTDDALGIDAYWQRVESHHGRGRHETR